MVEKSKLFEVVSVMAPVIRDIWVFQQQLT